MHVNGFAHNDIHEHNIMLDSFNKPHLIDYDGVTRIIDQYDKYYDVLCFIQAVLVYDEMREKVILGKLIINDEDVILRLQNSRLYPTLAAFYDYFPAFLKDSAVLMHICAINTVEYKRIVLGPANRAHYSIRVPFPEIILKCLTHFNVLSDVIDYVNNLIIDLNFVPYNDNDIIQLIDKGRKSLITRTNNTVRFSTGSMLFSRGGYM